MTQQTDTFGWTIPVPSSVSDEDDDEWGDIVVEWIDNELESDVLHRDSNGALTANLDLGGNELIEAAAVRSLGDIFINSEDSSNVFLRFQENGSNRGGVLYAPGSGLIQLYNFQNTESLLDLDLSTSDVDAPNGVLSEQGNAVVTENQNEYRGTRTAVPLTELADGDTATGVRMRVPSGKTLYVYELGVQDDTGSVPSGLSVDVYDHGAAAAVASASTQHSEGSPLGSVSGATDVSVRVDNATGGSVLSSGFAVYSVV